MVVGRACGALNPSIGVTGPRICSKAVRAIESNGCTRPFADSGKRPNAVTSNPLPGPAGRGRAGAARYTTKMPNTIQGTRVLVITGKSLLSEELKGDGICVSRQTTGKFVDASWPTSALCRASQARADRLFRALSGI